MHHATHAAAGSRRALRDDVVRLERELFHLAATAAHADRDTIAVVRDVDAWTVSLIAALLTDELRRQPAASGELIRICRAEPRPGATGAASYGLVVDRASGAAH